MNQEEYFIEANVEYPVIDDGTYAPIGSNPLFVTLEVIRSGDNVDHPYAKGYITNDIQADEEDIPESKILINHIIEPTMETKYSRNEFDGFTHRFIVEFTTKEPEHSNTTIYSNSDSYQKLEDFIKEKKSEKVLSFKIVHRASKAQDEMASKFIDSLSW